MAKSSAKSSSEKEPKVFKIKEGRFKEELFTPVKNIELFDKDGNPVKSKDADLDTAMSNSHIYEKYSPADGPFVYGTVKDIPFIIKKSDLEVA